MNIKKFNQLFEDLGFKKEEISYQDWREIKNNTINFTKEELKILSDISDNLDNNNSYYRLDISRSSIVCVCRNPKKIMEKIFHIEKYENFFIKYNCTFWREPGDSYSERSCTDRFIYHTNSIMDVFRNL
jgi:hypothetical protein